MKGLQRIFWLHLLVGAGSLAAGYAARGIWVAGIVLAGLGGLWAFAQAKLGPRGMAAGNGMLALLIAAAVVGMLAEVPAWLGLLGVTGTLGAWDLDHFMRRLYGEGSGAGAAGMADSLGRAHLRHLLAVEAVGIAAGLLAVAARLDLPFWWVMLLVALAVIGLGQVVRQLRAQVGEEDVEE